MSKAIENFNKLLERRKKALSLGPEKVSEFRTQFDDINHGIVAGIGPYLQEQLQIFDFPALFSVLIEAERIGALHHFAEGIRLGEVKLVELGIDGMRDLTKGKVRKHDKTD